MRYGVEVRWRLFDLVCSGTPVERAARELGVSKTAAHEWWYHAGGMKLVEGGKAAGLERPGRPDMPGGRGHRLSLDERITIMAGRVQRLTMQAIGELIGRDKSVVSRELTRNANPDGSYHAGLAHARAAERAQRPKPFKLVDHPMQPEITNWLDHGWSPRLVAQWLARHFGGDRLRRVSHETIYQCLYVQTKGTLRADLWQRLSTKRAARKPQGRVENRGKPYAEAFRIAQRPASAEDRSVPGHWEGDLIVGPGNRSAIGTLVERSTRFTLLLHLPVDHTAETVAAAMIKAMKDLPAHLRRSLTWDRGVELSKYRDIQIKLEFPVFFCDPHSPWQRGTNENTNRLLRFWFAKGTDLSVYTQADLRRVQNLLNNRPRPTLDLDTPAQRLAGLIEKAA